LQQVREQKLRLLDHLIGTAEQRDWKIDAESLGRFHINYKLYFARLLDRQIGGLLTPENPRGINTGQTECLRNVRPVAQQPPSGSDHALCMLPALRFELPTWRAVHSGL
jgi:hypothetical protein